MAVIGGFGQSDYKTPERQAEVERAVLTYPPFVKPDIRRGRFDAAKAVMETELAQARPLGSARPGDVPLHRVQHAPDASPPARSSVSQAEEGASHAHSSASSSTQTPPTDADRLHALQAEIEREEHLLSPAVLRRGLGAAPPADTPQIKARRARLERLKDEAAALSPELSFGEALHGMWRSQPEFAAERYAEEAFERELDAHEAIAALNRGELSPERAAERVRIAETLAAEAERRIGQSAVSRVAEDPFLLLGAAGAIGLGAVGSKVVSGRRRPAALRGELTRRKAEPGVAIHRDQPPVKDPALGAHHVHGVAIFTTGPGGRKKRLFIGDYHEDNGISLSVDFMNKHGKGRTVNGVKKLPHDLMTKHQTQAYKQARLAKKKAGLPLELTLREHSQIAVDAMIAAGFSRQTAWKVMRHSLNNLRAQGVDLKASYRISGKG
ncbi:MAG: hypothetical protein AAF909_12470 [Pseudomonadota bacterium]